MQKYLTELEVLKGLIRSLKDVTEKPIEWLWDKGISKGKLTLLARLVDVK